MSDLMAKLAILNEKIVIESSFAFKLNNRENIGLTSIFWPVEGEMTFDNSNVENFSFILCKVNLIFSV